MKTLLSFILLSILLALYSCQPKQLATDHDQFTGRWTLDIVERKNHKDAAWIPRTGNYQNRKGFIIYDGLGGMGVHHVNEDYEKYPLPKVSLDSLTKKDLRHLANNFVYFGKYQVNDSLKIIEHFIESTNFIGMWGKVAKRKYEFNGDTLILSSAQESFPKMRLKWIKLNDKSR
jgi:hypothetical protein